MNTFPETMDIKGYKGYRYYEISTKYLPRSLLLTICKSFIRHRLDYGDILYNNTGNENLKSILIKVQY